MNVAIAAERWEEAGGGRERYLAGLAAFLVRRGDTVRIYCTEVRSPVGLTGADITVLGRAGAAGTRRLQHAVEEWRAVNPGQPVLTAHPLAVATHYMLSGGLLREALEAERESFSSSLRRTLFWPATTLNRRRRFLLREEQRLLSRADGPKLMVFTDEIRDTLVMKEGVARDRVRVSRPGVDLERFRPPVADDGSSWRCGRGGARLLFVGHNYALKGLVPLLMAVARSGHTGARPTLTVVGRGPIARFQRLAGRLAIAERVTFCGPMNQTEVADLYRRCDGLVLPTFHDPFPAVIVEALASGCPVITTRRCGASCLITPGVNGDLIDDPRDTQQLVAAIARVCDASHLIKLREAASAGRSRLSFDAHAAEVAAWLGG